MSTDLDTRAAELLEETIETDKAPAAIAPASREHLKMLAVYHLAYSIAGLIAGLTCVLFGAWLYVRQVTESLGWIAGPWQFGGFLVEAFPGVLLVVAGLVIVFVTRFRRGFNSGRGRRSQVRQ